MNSEVIPGSEITLTHLLNQYRSGLENFIGISFPTIMAYNEHAALPHYSATPESDLLIDRDGILLVDSGGQYLDGTTDITRTISLGNPTARQKKDFTLVLKGMIKLATAVFPSGTYGYQVDVLARQYLWENGLNYGHGTGHGVGFCLNVHEGPQRISVAAGNDKEAFLKPGMVVSDEPAVYREGEYGIRTENLLLCYEDEETEFGKFNRFSTLSLCYIDTTLIERSLLDRKEISWLNDYHREVYLKISPHLNTEEQKWLKVKTSEI
jgi:Xaa-Pro aminopeptidase